MKTLAQISTWVAGLYPLSVAATVRSQAEFSSGNENDPAPQPLAAPFRDLTVAATLRTYAGLVLLLALGWFGGGCATTSAPKRGRGIAEYRQVVGEARESVAATVKALEGLVLSPTGASVPPAALGRFDQAFNHLELASVKARARAQAIIARGQAYFDEWKTNLSSITNQAAARAETERFDRLFDHFDRVRQRSGEVREEFRPFMAKLREFRAALDGNGGVVSNPSSQSQLPDLTASGRRVLRTLDSVSTALDDAEAELCAMPQVKR